MSSYLPNREFAADQFLICLSYAIVSLKIVQNVHKMFGVHTLADVDCNLQT